MVTWDEFWGSLDFLPVVGWILGPLMVIGFFAKAWPKLRAAVKLIDSLAVLPAFIERTDKAIGDIRHEVMFNNGSSVKDAVTRVEAGVKGLHEKVDNQKVALELADEDIRHDLERTQPQARKPRNKPKETP